MQITAGSLPKCLTVLYSKVPRFWYGLQVRTQGLRKEKFFFRRGFRLRMREELDFACGLITSYGYEAYRGGERLWWYDDFPHPHDASLASTFPHHKHIPPEIKRNRIPAPGISFDRPNLQFVVRELEEIIEKEGA